MSSFLCQVLVLNLDPTVTGLLRIDVTTIEGSIWRRRVVGVMGSGRSSYDGLAEPLGVWIARQGFHLLTGGGGGVMAAVGKGFSTVANRKGLVVGVLPCAVDGPRSGTPLGYPNTWVELVIRTHLPLSGVQGLSALSRNHINVLSADVLIALPGGFGTMSEIELASKYDRPCIAFIQDKHQAVNLPEGMPVATSLNDVAAFVLQTTSPD